MSAEGGGEPLPRIGVVATDPMRIAGLRFILEAGRAYEVVTLDATNALASADLALAIVDSSATSHLFELLTSFRNLRPGLALIVLGAQADSDHMERVIGAGAKGYLNHSASESELQTAIAVVRDGSVWAPRKVMARLLETTLKTASGNHAVAVDFTPRELEVLQLLVLGQPNRQIAAALGVDEGTVKAHMGRLMRKAGVDNRTALTMRAIERRWAAN